MNKVKVYNAITWLLLFFAGFLVRGLIPAGILPTVGDTPTQSEVATSTKEECPPVNPVKECPPVTTTACPSVTTTELPKPQVVTKLIPGKVKVIEKKIPVNCPVCEVCRPPEPKEGKSVFTIINELRN